MKNILFLLLMFFFLTACTKYYEDGTEIIRGLNVTEYNQMRVASAGDYFEDSVGLRIIGHGEFSDPSNYKVIFEIEKGGGTIEKSEVQVNNGFALTRWKSGAEESLQILNVKVTDKNHEVYYEYKIKASALAPNRWDSVYVPYKTYFHYIKDIQYDTQRQQSFLLLYCGLHKRKQNYYDWEFSSGIRVGECPHEFVISRNGTYYAVGQSGNIYVSYNGADSWLQCELPQGFIQEKTLYRLAATENGFLWASDIRTGTGTHLSKDDGQTWQQLDADFSIVTNIHSMPNGDIFLFGDYGMLYKSEDNGQTWEQLSVPENPYHFFVAKTGEMILLTQQSRVNIFKSSNFGESWEKFADFLNTSDVMHGELILEFSGQYFILIGGYGIVKTTDFETYEIFFENRNLRAMHRDHESTLIALDKYDPDIMYYYRFD